jgi:hypothetical protein
VPQDPASEPSDDASTATGSPTATTAPAGGSGESSPQITSTQAVGDDATAIDSESVARVGGSPVPMGFLLVLAGGLALGGYLMLAGPGLLSTCLAARRQRR